MYVFIVNPVSGKGRGKRVWSKVEALLQQDRVSYEVYFTKGPDDGTKIVESLVDNGKIANVQSMITVGGDGTLNEVLNGYMRANLQFPIGIIPAGSGNDLARSLGSTKWRDYYDAIFAEKLVPIDIGRINQDHYIINNIGIGFDAEVGNVANRAWYKKWLNLFRLGKLLFIIGFFQVVFRYKRQKVQVITEDGTKSWENTWLVAVSNIKNYGGGMKICPDAEYDDGKFQVCVVHGVGTLKLVSLFPKVFNGSHKGIPYVEFFDAKRIEIITERPSIVHMDGEIRITSPVTIEVLPLRVKVYAPLN